MEQEATGYMDNELRAKQELETFPLDDAAIAMVAEIEQQMRPLNVALQAILSYFARQHDLQGRWQLAPNKKELVKAP